MVVAHGVHRVEAREVVLVRRVRAVPRDDVERRVVDLGLPEPALELRDDAEVAVALLVGRDRREEVARVREPVRADRPEIGQAEVRAVVLAYVAASGTVLELDAELDAARHDADLARRDVQDAELRADRERTELRRDQELAVRVVEEAILHRRVRGVHVHRGAGLQRGIAVAAERDEPLDEVRRRLRDRQRSPAELIRRRGHLVERRATQRA